MQAVVLEKANELRIREIDVDETMGPHDVRISIKVVGICGSDVHYLKHGGIGSYIVHEPMILGHEASGEVIETGRGVKNLRAGDRVCMEPGVPDPNSRASRLGIYNLDPAVRFWATPPHHGVLRPSVVHPAGFTFKLPDSVSFAEGAMVEPLAIGLHAARKAEIKPGDTAVVMGSGTIGIMTALSAIAGGCSSVIITDVKQEKLDIAGGLGPITPVNITRENLGDVVAERTDGWGADIVFEASGSAEAVTGIFEPLCPGGSVVFIGMQGSPVAVDLDAATVKEARMATIFRYAHEYPRAIALMESGRIDVKPLITASFAFKDSLKAFEFAAGMQPGSIKTQIVVGD
jgi:D-xylulose reductase